MMNSFVSWKHFGTHLEHAGNIREATENQRKPNDSANVMRAKLMENTVINSIK